MRIRYVALLLVCVLASAVYLYLGSAPHSDDPAVRRLRIAHVSVGPTRREEPGVDARLESTQVPVVGTWSASTRPVAGFAAWHPAIVSRTVVGLWASDARLGVSVHPGIDVSAEGVYVDSGWYQYVIPWEEVEDVYSAATNDSGNPEILCIKRKTGELLVLSDLALGPETASIAAAALAMRTRVSTPGM